VDPRLVHVIDQGWLYSVFNVAYESKDLKIWSSNSCVYHHIGVSTNVELLGGNDHKSTFVTHENVSYLMRIHKFSKSLSIVHLEEKIGW
jgi:hypothetical protein